MSSIDVDLEALTDKQLRQKCLEYGLPNVPVTDTSKKILIRKLRIAMGGEPESSKKSSSKNRRETFHSVKLTGPTSTADDSKTKAIENKKSIKTTASSRRTIAVSARDPSPPPRQVVDHTIEKRRSGRGSSLSYQKNDPKLDVPPVIIEDMDFDEDIGYNEPIALLKPSSILTKNLTNSRNSRSPSLSKSIVVTTSYGKEKNVPASIPEAIDLEEDDHEYEDLYKQHYGNLSQQLYGDFRKNKINREEEIIVASRYIEPTIQPSKEIEFPVGYRSLYPNLTSANTSSYSYDTTTTTKRYGALAENPTKILTNSSKLLTSPQISSPSRKYIENSDEDENIDEAHTPYLSDFARRLSSLKADQLDIGVKKEDYSAKPVSGSRYYNTGRRNIRYNNTDNSVYASFKRFLLALDQKYKLSRTFFILLLLSIIILTIYYYFF